MLSTVFQAYLTGLSSSELSHLFDILFVPYRGLLADDTVTLGAKLGLGQSTFQKMCSHAQTQLKHVGLSRRTGTLRMLHDVVKQLGMLVHPYIDTILRVELGILQAALHEIDHHSIHHVGEGEGHNESREQYLELRGLAVKEILLVFQQYARHECFATFVPAFRDTLIPWIKMLPSEGMQAQSPSIVLQCLNLMTQHEQIMPILFVGEAPEDGDYGTITLRSLISCLRVKRVAQSIIDMLLHTVLNILKYESGYGNAKTYICPLVVEFLSALRNRIDAVVSDKRRQYDALDGTLIEVLCELAKITTDKAQITAIVELFVPFLQLQGVLRKDRLLPILALFKNLAPMLETPEALFLKLSRLWYSVRERDAREALLGVFHAIAARCTDEQMRQTACILEDLNAYSSSRIGEYDFNRRLGAYRKFEKTLEMREQFKTMTSVIPGIYNCFFDMADADLSIRTRAASCITSVVKELQAAHEACEDKTNAAQLNCSTILADYIMPMLKLGLKRSDDVVRDEYVKLLRSVVLLMPKRYPDMILLTDKENPETDIFNNIVHIQLHRRVRALGRLRSVLQTGSFSAATIVGWLIPLVTHYIYTPNVIVSAGGTRGGKDVIKQGGHNLAQAAVDAIGEMCRHLPWGKYHRTLLYFLRATTSHATSAKVLIRLTCAIADNYHFDSPLQDRSVSSLTDIAAASDEKTAAVEDGGLAENAIDTLDDIEVEAEDDETANGASSGLSRREDPQAMRKRIESTLINRILPEFYKHLTEPKKPKKGDDVVAHKAGTENDGDGIRQAVALTIIKLLQALPDATLQAQVPRLVAVLSASLKSHLQSVRDEARATMVAVATSLGAHYINFIIEDMRSVLVAGYQKHVLMFTLHSLLVAMTPKIKTGELDYCLDSMLPILQDELVGAMSHEKEVDALTKKSR
eukprot:SAG31_NODE_206_length_20335_cov_17.910160_5_plen_921_part_00